jgi:hypothetical protein
MTTRWHLSSEPKQQGNRTLQSDANRPMFPRLSGGVGV